LAGFLEGPGSEAAMSLSNAARVSVGVGSAASGVSAFDGLLNTGWITTKAATTATKKCLKSIMDVDLQNRTTHGHP